MTTFDGLSTSKGSGATLPTGPQEPTSGAPAAYQRRIVVTPPGED